MLRRQNETTLLNMNNVERKQGPATTTRDTELTDNGQCCVIPFNLLRLKAS